MPLLDSLDEIQLALAQFSYISVHAPSKRENLSELELVAQLGRVSAREWAIVVHPDMIVDFALWNKLGLALCIENMDKRKAGGRTTGRPYGMQGHRKNPVVG